MADRYWVGGSGTWNTTSTTNWSTSSGGPGGASVPTAADNVIFDSATTYTVTMTGALTCLDFTISAGTVTLNNGTSPTLTISGNLSIIAGTVWNMSGNVTFNATTSKTITTNDVTINSSFIFDGAGGTWTLGSAATLNFTNITINNGGFSTSASNYTLYLGGFIINANSNTKSLSLNGSTITTKGNPITNNSTGNFTFNAGTSNWVISTQFGGSELTTFSTQSLTFYNVISDDEGFGEANLFYLNFSALDSSVVYTFNNFTFNSAAYITSYVRSLTIPAFSGTTNMVINGTLTMIGSSMQQSKRVVLRGQFNGAGKDRGLSAVRAGISAASVNLVDVDFYCINNTGPSAWTGTRLGDMGNNTNITTTTPKTVYYSAATLGSWEDANWANTSGGSVGNYNYPLFQDEAIIDNNSGTGTLLLDYGSFYGDLYSGGIYNMIGSLNASSRTNSMNVQFSFVEFLRNFTVSSNVRLVSSRTGQAATIPRLRFSGTSNSTFTTGNNNTTIVLPIEIFKANANATFTNNVTSNQSLTISLSSGTFSLSNGIQVSSITHGNGTINLQGTTLTTNTYTTNPGIKNIRFDAGTFNCTENFNNNNPGGFSITQGVGYGNIRMTSATSKNFIGGSNNYTGVILRQVGAGMLTISGSNSFEDIVNDYKDTGNTTIRLTAGTTQTLNNFSANGTSGKFLTINSTSIGTQATLSKSSGTINASFLILRDNNANGGAYWTGSQITVLDNVSGWNLPSPSGFLVFF